MVHFNFGLEGATTASIIKKYKLKEILGKGSFGVVRRCRSKKTGEECAVKTILKSKVPNLDSLKREIDILKDVDHPHIIKLYDVYEDEKSFHLVTELCSGGELYDRVVEKTQSPEGHYSEYDAARIIRNILDAIAYCHDVKHIVHRDLKPENFLLLNKEDDSPVKIIDFGLSRRSDFGVMQSRVGTAYYVAPEVLTDDYTFKCDIWSIGVITFVLLCGFPPFFAENERLTIELVKKAEVDFPSPVWDDISDEAKEFVKYLLEVDPEKRPSASEALKHPWLNHSKVNPSGVSQRASFACAKRKSFGETAPLKMHHNHRSLFQRLLLGTKIKKTHKAVSAI